MRQAFKINSRLLGSSPSNLSNRIDTYHLPASGRFEAYYTLDQGEKRVIGTSADVFAGMDLGATLSDKYIACGYGFAAVYLDS
jgi:hypothetical protein